MTQPSIENIQSFDHQVVSFYLSQADEVDAEKLTRDKFDISDETLNYILMSDLVESFSK